MFSLLESNGGIWKYNCLKAEEERKPLPWPHLWEPARSVWTHLALRVHHSADKTEEQMVQGSVPRKRISNECEEFLVL